MNAIKRYDCHRSHRIALETGSMLEADDGEYVLHRDYSEAYGAYFKDLKAMDAKVLALEAEVQRLREALAGAERALAKEGGHCG